MSRLRVGAAGRGFAYILGGGVGAQIVSVAVLPLLSRIFSPAEFGYFALVVALATVATSVATLRFETAAMLPDDIEAVRALAWNALLASLCISLTYAIVLEILVLVDLGDLAGHAWLPAWVFSLVFLGAVFSTLSQLALRNQEYGLVARRTLARSGATAAIQLGTGLLGRTVDGLIIGAVAGNLVGIASMYSKTRSYLARPSRASLMGAWRTYWRFPAVFAPSALLNALGLQAPILFFTFTYGIALGGQLGMAERVVTIPLTVIGVAVGQVLDAEVSKRLRSNEPNLTPVFLRISGLLTLLAAAVGIFFALLGGWAVPFVLGQEWSAAGEMVQILTLTACIRLVANPVSRILPLLQKSLAVVVLDGARVVIMIGTMLTAIAMQMPVISAIWLVYSGLSFTYVATWIYTFIATRGRRTTP